MRAATDSAMNHFLMNICERKHNGFIRRQAEAFALRTGHDDFGCAVQGYSRSRYWIGVNSCILLLALSATKRLPSLSTQSCAG